MYLPGEKICYMNSPFYTDSELLYFGYGDTPSHGMHSHDFYQIEFCIFGNIPGITEQEKVSLQQGEFWLIPPGLRHRFLKREYLKLLQKNSRKAFTDYLPAPSCAFSAEIFPSCVCRNVRNCI